MILRKLSEWDDNQYSTKLLDFYLYPGPPKGALEETKGSEDDCEAEGEYSQKHLTHVLLVLEKSPYDLRQMLKSHTNLDEEHIVIILYNILCSLNYIHAAGVIHRDIKPSNILIDMDSQIKICDFGISRCTARTDTLPKAEQSLKESKRHHFSMSYSTDDR